MTTRLQTASAPSILERLPRRIGSRSAGMLLTPEEFDAIPEDRWTPHLRYELINGVLVVSPMPLNAELDPNQYIGHLLIVYQESHPQGSIIDATLNEQTILCTDNRRRCDRAIWTGLGRVPDVEKDVPTIVVEFVSATRRDRMRDYEVKLREYMKIGVVEYWVIDRFQRTLTSFRREPLAADGLRVRVVKESEFLETDLLPGFVLPLGRILASADRWKKPPKKRDRKIGK